MAFNIGPRIGVEGEKELKEALRAIIAEFKTLDAEMKAMETAFKRGEQSQKAYTDYQNKAAQAAEVLNRLTEEYAKWLGIASERQGENSSYAERYRTEIAKVGAEQENLKTRAQNAAEAEKEFASNIEQTSDALSELETALLAAGIVKGLDNIKELLLDCSDAAKEFETGMAAVSRTTGLEGSGLDSMAETLKELSTEMPITTTELANIVSTAGQLGIKTADLEKFSTVMAKLGTATELTSESAATMLAQLVNITGTTEYDRLGSMFAYLGDATAATTTKIVEMSQAMAASASVAGLNERAIAAIAASVASLGIESQAGGTAMSTLVSSIYKAIESGDGLEEFARVANMSAGEFKAAWGRDAGAALASFIDGLNDAERNGKSAIMVLEELGITNVRQTRAILGLAEAEGMLSTNLALANKAWNENTALTEKASKMYDTTEARFVKFENSVNNLKIAIGEDLNVALAELADTGADAADWAAEFVNTHPGFVAAVSGMATATGLLSTGITGLLVASKAAVGIQKLTQAVKMLTATGLGKWGLIITGVTAALSGLAAAGSMLSEVGAEAKDLAADVESSADAFAEQSDAMERSVSETQGVIDAIGRLSEKENKSAADKKLLAQLVDDLNETLPSLALNYDEEADALTRAGAAAEWTTDAIIDMAEALNKERQQAQYVERMSELLAERATITEKLAAAEAILRDPSSKWFEKEDAKTAMYEYKQALADIDTEYGSLTTEIENFNTAVESSGEDLTGLEGILYDAKVEMDALAKAYQEAYDKIYSAIEGVGGPLDELKANTEITTSQIGKNLSQQVGYWEDYNANLETLLGRDIEGIERLVEHFNDGSADSAGALAALASATDEELQKMVDDLDKAEEFKRGIAGAFADVQTQASAKMSAIVSDTSRKIGQLNLSPQAKTAGMNTLQGYINGLNSKSGSLYNRVWAIASNVIANMKAALGIASPSKVFKGFGEFTMLGYIEGIKNEERAVEKAMQHAAQSALDAFNAQSVAFDGFEVPTISGVYDRMGGSLAGGSMSTTTNNKTINLGGITLTVNAAAGQSAQDIAEAVMDAIQAEVERKGAVFA